MIDDLPTQIAAAINMRALYPANHPRVVQTIEQIVAGLHRYLQQQQSEPEESCGVLPQCGRVRTNCKAEEQQRDCAEDKNRDRLRASPPLQQQLFAQRGDHLTRPFSSASCTSANRSTRST